MMLLMINGGKCQGSVGIWIVNNDKYVMKYWSFSRPNTTIMEILRMWEYMVSSTPTRLGRATIDI
jgi:hypothetical protein